LSPERIWALEVAEDNEEQGELPRCRDQDDILEVAVEDHPHDVVEDHPHDDDPAVEDDAADSHVAVVDTHSMEDNDAADILDCNKDEPTKAPAAVVVAVAEAELSHSLELLGLLPAAFQRVARLFQSQSLHEWKERSPGVLDSSCL
jgi:hypothetical protein